MKTNNQNGFTLIETIIYVAIIGLVIGSFISFSISLSNSRNKFYATQEVQANLRTALNVINQKIKSANGVNTASSVFGSDPGAISLSMSDASKNPTIFNLTADDGVLQIQEGTDPAVAITSDEVKVTELIFYNRTGSSTRANIGAKITIEYNVDTGVDFSYTKSARTSISLRK